MKKRAMPFDYNWTAKLTAHQQTTDYAKRRH